MKQPYRLRTKIRGYLPWFLIDLGLASKGQNCKLKNGEHEWYNIDGETSGCYHCEVVRDGQLWSQEETMHLPTLQDNHYELDNAELLHNDYPDTFDIPLKKLRDTLPIGTIVKLIFRMESKVDNHKTEVERMWVEIIDKKGDIYIGALDNDPCADVHLKYQQTIYFQSKHIIDIFED